MPITFSNLNINYIHWIYIPNEIINFEPYLNATMIIIRPGVLYSGLIIPSLKIFKSVNTINIHFKEITGITDYPDNIHTLSLHETSIVLLDNIPTTIKMIRLTSNPFLNFSTIPPNINTLEAYCQPFDKIHVNPNLTMLSLCRCTFNYISGLEKCNISNFIAIRIYNCICPYPQCYELLTQYIAECFTEIYLINRQMYYDTCLPLTEIHIKSMNEPTTINDSKALTVFRTSSNYPRRITEFLGANI